MEVDWSAAKNAELVARHGVGFEEVVLAILEDRTLADLPHHDPGRSHQGILVVEIGGYAWAVPYVPTPDGKFLKTLYPSRNLTARVLRRPT